MAKAYVIGVSVGADGTVWCVDSVGLIYKMEGAEWRRNPVAKQVKEVAVGNASNVWCRNAKGEVFQLQVAAWNGNWTKDAEVSNARTLSAGEDGTVWVGNEQGKLFQRSDTGWKENPHATDAQEVAVGCADNVWYRNAAGKVYQLQGSQWDGIWVEDGQASWVQTIAAASDGTVWLGSADPADKDRLFKREGPNKWKKNPSAIAARVSTGGANLVYSVNAAGQIHRLIGQSWNDDWDRVPLPDLPKAHLIRDNETLSSIVEHHYGLSGPAANAKVSVIVAVNGIEDRDRINAGELIALP